MTTSICKGRPGTTLATLTRAVFSASRLSRPGNLAVGDTALLSIAMMHAVAALIGAVASVASPWAFASVLAMTIIVIVILIGPGLSKPRLRPPHILD